ncbi:MAG: EamA family transporter [Nitrososphaerota archaeon]
MEQGLRPDLMFALVAFVGIGLTDFIRKKGSVEGAQPAQYLLLETLILLGFVGAFALLTTGPDFMPNRAAAMYAPISAITIGVGLLALLHGLQHGQGSVVIPISRLGLSLASILSILLLGEPVTLTKALGIALAAVAVLLLSM